MRTADEALAVLIAPGDRWGWQSVDYSPLFVPYPEPQPVFDAPPPPPVTLAAPRQAMPGSRWRIAGLPLPVVIVGAIVVPPVIVAILEAGHNVSASRKSTYTSIGSVIWVIEFLVIAAILGRRFLRPRFAKVNQNRAVSRHGVVYAAADEQ